MVTRKAQVESYKIELILEILKLKLTRREQLQLLKFCKSINWENMSLMREVSTYVRGRKQLATIGRGTNHESIVSSRVFANIVARKYPSKRRATIFRKFESTTDLYATIDYDATILRQKPTLEMLSDAPIRYSNYLEAFGDAN